MEDTSPDTLFGIDAEKMAIGDTSYQVPVETAAPVSEPLPEMDPAEEAAMKFTHLLPYVKKFGAAMSAKGLIRVIHATAEFPLGAGKPRLLNDAERQLFQIIQELNGCKSTVIQNIIKQSQQPMAVAETEVKNESSESKE